VADKMRAKALALRAGHEEKPTLRVTMVGTPERRKVTVRLMGTAAPSWSRGSRDVVLMEDREAVRV
jgi:hypothetical protein